MDMDLLSSSEQNNRFFQQKTEQLLFVLSILQIAFAWNIMKAVWMFIENKSPVIIIYII